MPGGYILGVPTAEWIGVVIAFVTAGGMIYLDCHQTVSGVVRYVPDAFFRSSRVLALAAAGGAVAAALYLITTPSGQDVVSQQAGVKQANAFLRALTVGVVALALIRSKFFKAGQVDLGGEYVYVKLRERVLLPIVVGWNTLKNRFIKDNVGVCLGVANFVDDTLATIRQTVKAGPPDEVVSGLSQIEQVEKDRPATAFSATAAEWVGYYRTVMRLALDTCGPSIFEDAAFTWPK